MTSSGQPIPVDDATLQQIALTRDEYRRARVRLGARPHARGVWA